MVEELEEKHIDTESQEERLFELTSEVLRNFCNTFIENGAVITVHEHNLGKVEIGFLDTEISLTTDLLGTFLMDLVAVCDSEGESCD